MQTSYLAIIDTRKLNKGLNYSNRVSIWWSSLSGLNETDILGLALHNNPKIILLFIMYNYLVQEISTKLRSCRILLTQNYMTSQTKPFSPNIHV